MSISQKLSKSPALSNATPRSESKLERVQRLKLTHLIACGGHSNRYCENDGVWDLSCRFCLGRLEVIVAMLAHPAAPPIAEGPALSRKTSNRLVPTLGLRAFESCYHDYYLDLNDMQFPVKCRNCVFKFQLLEI